MTLTGVQVVWVVRAGGVVGVVEVVWVGEERGDFHD